VPATSTGADRAAGAGGGETSAAVGELDVRPQAAKKIAAAAMVPPQTIRCTAGDTLATSPEQSNHERCDEQHQENEEQHLGDLGRASGNPAETKNRCNNRYDKKYQRVVEHL
jgi:hypothetical protein